VCRRAQNVKVILAVVGSDAVVQSWQNETVAGGLVCIPLPTFR